ncbi:enhancer of split m6 protein [Drosophila ficusphila]|uniref:enhancer of split m6 protein n=1 Tax=Drosophila ficusphila TaxID=30025 RepID=UPI0007E851C2|nr:enhancer of split m6 protein [Drosophila ficusphila]
MSKVKNLLAKMLQRFGKSSAHNDSQRYDSLEEIAQNQANERMLRETHFGMEEHLVICLETSAGSFYWHSQ